MRRQNREERQKNTKTGPGFFVYVGGMMDHETIPGVQETKNGAPVWGGDRKPIWAKPPTTKFTPVDVFMCPSTESDPDGKPVALPMKKDEPVEIKNPMIAFKLRGMKYIKEIDPVDLKKHKSNKE